MPLTTAHFTYLGGMIMPKQASSDVTYLPDSYPPDGQTRDALNMGGRPFAVDPVRKELLLGTRYGRIVRVQMIEPGLHTGDDVNTFPTAPYVVPTMVDLSGVSAVANPPTVNKSWFEIADPFDTANTSFGGCQPVEDQILLSGQMYYDANNTQRKSVALANWPAVPPANDYLCDRTPFRAVGDPGSQGLVAGYFAPIPAEYQEVLKGNMLMGNSSLPIISRGSAGPCATSFWVEHVLTSDPVPTTLLVGYPQGHWMPGHPWDNMAPDDIYNQTSQITGMAIIGDTIVFVGSHGYGEVCYGNGTSDPALAGQPSPDGSHYCYDPTSTAKAGHAYPYRLQVWYYPVADLVAVTAGEKAPWDLVPDWLELEVPFKQPNNQVNGCAYDPLTQRLYLSMYAADGYGYEPGPVIYVFQYGDVEPPDPPAHGLGAKAIVVLTAALVAEKQRHAATTAHLNEALNRLAAIEDDAEAIAEETAHILSLTNAPASKKKKKRH